MPLLQRLVPVLNLFALSSLMTAADQSPTLTFSGWSDNVLSVSDDTILDDSATLKKESTTVTRFSSTASLKTNWKVGDKVSAKINILFAPTAASNHDQAVLREACANYQINDVVGVRMGKCYSDLGWVGPEPIYWHLVNPSLINYNGTAYGNDPLGVNVLLTPGGPNGKLSAVIGVNNGNFTSTDAYNGAPNANRSNQDLGWVLHLSYGCCQAATLVVEGAYDTHSTYNAFDNNALGGNVAMLGINLTTTPIKPLLIGAEIIAMHAGTGQLADGTGYGGAEKIYQGMLLANYTLSGTPCPMSVTVSDQYIVQINDEKYSGATSVSGQTKSRSNGLQAALKTNPTASNNFGVNLEVGWKQELSETGSTTSNVTGWETALEALVVF